MANMSYCRWHNTRIDVADCLDSIDYFNDYDNEKISAEEADNAKRMFRRFLDFCKDHEIVEEYDLSVVDAMIDRISEPDEED